MLNLGGLCRNAEVSYVTALPDLQPLASHASYLIHFYPSCQLSTFNLALVLIITMYLSFMLVILFIIPLTALILGPRIGQAFGQALGWYLRRKTAGRREQILETVEEDEKILEKEGGRRGSDEWENVESYTVGTAKNGEKADKEWDGIVGFFHPFW
jgi:hypothetical protein